MIGVLEFVLIIIGMVFVFQLMKQRMAGREDGGLRLPPLADDKETQRLRDEVIQLKERVKVLERITVEKENSLERQIEELRDR